MMDHSGQRSYYSHVNICFFLNKSTLIVSLNEISIDFISFADSIVPVTICLLIERGLAEEVVKESAGMCAHVVNIIVLVLLPMVIIHVNGDAFNLSKFVYIFQCHKRWHQNQSMRNEHFHYRNAIEVKENAIEVEKNALKILIFP